jgi:hypothetical protein
MTNDHPKSKPLNVAQLRGTQPAHLLKSVTSRRSNIRDVNHQNPWHTATWNNKSLSRRSRRTDCSLGGNRSCSIEGGR